MYEKREITGRVMNSRILFDAYLIFQLSNVASLSQVVISVYEVVSMILNRGRTLREFSPWAKYLIVLNTLLVVLNSSINFGFYCGDVVFRECLSTISKTGCTCTLSSQVRARFHKHILVGKA